MISCFHVGSTMQRGLVLMVVIVIVGGFDDGSILSSVRIPGRDFS